MSRPLPIVLATLAALPAVSMAQQDLVLPRRSPTATLGSQLVQAVRGLSVTDREELVWHEVLAGNVPDFLRTFVPVTITATIQGRSHTATFRVAPDYLGVGSDSDWFRMPMTPLLAQPLIERLGCVLPTRKMVDAIWTQAAVKLAPFPFSPTQYDILSSDLFYQHHLHIEGQRSGAPLGQLVAGIKKDVVSSALIAAWPTRVVIYGWHQLNGAPIQPLSKVHVNFYADYSHGIRLVRDAMTLDGVPTTVTAVLADPVLNALLSDEGPIGNPSYVVPPPPATFPFHDDFPSSGPELSAWRPKFTAPATVGTTPPAPGGDGFAVRVMDPAGGTDTFRLGAGNIADYAVEATLYCDYRPQLGSDGFERVGIFARDRAQGAFDGTLSQVGACYALAWDSDDGHLWCMRASGGVLTDLCPQPIHLPSTAWRTFRIEVRGSELTFVVDGVRVLRTTDTTFPDGEFGIGHHEFFATNAHARGTLADRFHADVPAAFTTSLSSGPAPGQLVVGRARGVPGDFYLTAVTPNRGAFPNGAFFGIDLSAGELLSELGSGHPVFVGRLDEAGGSGFTVNGVPPGLALYGVSLDLDSGLGVAGVSMPVSVVTR